MDFDIDNLPFEPGDRVKHKVFGIGTVTDIDKEMLVYVIDFDNMPTERRLGIKTTALVKCE